MRVATIGVGSNSVRMMVASIENGQVKLLLRDRAGTRLFASLDGTQTLSAASMQPTLDAIEAQYQKAKAFGAQEITVFATSAVRDAQNKQLFCDEVMKRTGTQLDVLSGQSEAALSFLGATDREKRSGVIDIGGGSTEIVLGKGERIDYSFSHQMGAVRLYQFIAINSPQAIEPAIEEAMRVLESVDKPENAKDACWIGVGGTATTLAAIAHRIAWTETVSVNGLVITLEDAMKAAQMLAPMDVETRKGVIGMRPQRADIVVHGICILIACMRMLGIDAITVSESGNLNGYIYRKYADLLTENL